MEKERKERMKRMTCKGIAGIVMMAIVVAFITVGITAVEATAEEPFSIEDCSNCPDSGMELYDRHYSLWILRCGYHNVVDSKDNSGTMHIFAFTNADDAESRFTRMRDDDLKTAERHYSNNYKILRNDENEFVWIFTSPGIISPDGIYIIIGYFLYKEENRMTEVNIRAAIKDEKIAIERFDALAECAKSVIDKKCGEKKEEIDLVVEIIVPVKNFEVKKGEKVDIVASVKDDLNNMVNELNTDSVVASFTTEKKIIELQDDGKHNDGGKDDGVYANTWTPTKTGDCTITVTAKKTDFKDGVDKVNGIVIAKPVLEIPARFKNVHPYKQYVCALPQSYFENAPVFQRGVEKPQFEVKGLTGLPSDYELRVVIEEPKGDGRYAVVKNLTISAGWTDDKVVGEWDYSTFSGMRNVESIPIGVYKAQAQLVNKATQDIVQQSVTKEFYVIFEWDSSKKDFITNDNAYFFNNYPWYLGLGYGRDEFKLHIYDERIWKFALEEITKTASIDYTSKEDVIKKLFGDIDYIDMIKYPDEIDDYCPGKNNMWYDNIKALDAKTGTCTDHSALSIGLLRAIGIPARMIDCSGTGGVGSNYGKDIDHAFFEAWYKGNWHWFDPTNVRGQCAGTCGSAEYTQTGIQFRPAGARLFNWGYWVITSGSVPGNTPPVNIYKRYNYNLDVVDLRFDKTSYKPGDTMNIEIDVKNTGEINIANPHLDVSMTTESIFAGPYSGYASKHISMSRLADVDVAVELKPNDPPVTKTVSGIAPPSDWQPYQPIMVYYIVAKPYTQWNTDKAYTFTYIRRIPGFSISPVYSINVDGVKKTFQRFNGSFFESNVSDEKAYIRDSYEWDGLPVNVELYSEIDFGRNYSKTVTTLENPDSESHVYNFSMPIYGFGDAAYIPPLGTITSNTALNAEASYIASYNQSSDEDINVSVYEFSKDARIKAIEVLEHKGVKLVKADACWNITLSPGSSHKICVYSSTRRGQPGIAGFDFSDIYTTLAKEIVDNGDSLMNLKLSAPEEVRVAETIPINVTVFNNGIVEETLNLFVNVSRTPRYSRTPNLIYTDTTSISVSPNTEKTLTYPVYISKDTAATVWDVSVDTDKVITATTAFTVNDAFDLDCIQDLEVVHNEVFPFNTTIINTWDTTVHDVKATIHLFGSFTTLDPEELHIGDLLPNERKTISWRLSTTYGGELPLDVSVTSEDGGSDAVGAMITSLASLTPENQPPVALFSYSPSNPLVNQIITFDATPSYDSDGFIVNCEWDFGDGCNKTGEAVTHAYTSSGNYNVILTVTDNDGAVDTETTGITVSGAKTIHVDDDFTDDPANHRWDTIQEGITDADDGDTVLVYVGTYTETVTLNKRLTLTGEEMPKIDAHGSGDAIKITADNCTVKGFCCVNAQPSSYAGIYVKSNNNVIVENTCEDNDIGLHLSGSSNEITNNVAKNNQHYGIRLWKSDGNIIQDNTAKGNSASGIRLNASDNNRIIDNDASNSVNYHGISLNSSNNNEVRNNVANSNHYHGIGLWSSSDNIIVKNTAKNNGNNGISLVNSNDNRIDDNDASNSVNYHGIAIDTSNNNEIRNNVANYNHYVGIGLWSSSDNIIAKNTAKGNENKGIYLMDSNNNQIYRNTFMDNDNNVYSKDSTNIWHSLSKMTYRFTGSTYKNYLGNYWDDYTGSDTDNDGIGDTPYNINYDNDIYPLKKPLESYFVALETNFDTGEPANQYPSIMGTHTGTIKPNQPITISKLYTYSCPGTGGHTEYIWIHGNGVDTSATWNGYQSTSDYHLIEFAAQVTLEEGVTYDYTIRTGSYPQIHHTNAVQTATGWLNCTAFEDKNGKIYYDRIPAVKFFY